MPYDWPSYGGSKARGIIIVPSLLIRSRQDEPFCSLLYERFGLGSLYRMAGRAANNGRCGY